MITIGEHQLQTARPADLDRQLISATGCNAAEIAQHMKGSPTAHSVARALRPFLPGDNPPTVMALTNAIAAADTAEVAAQVGQLYAEPVPTEAAAAQD